MASQANAPLADGTELDEYRIERLLASGGFSFVYRARDRLGTLCAIKEYMPATLGMRVRSAGPVTVPENHRSTFRHGLQCFFAEAKSLAGLRHPNVVRVLKFFRANGTAYMVMRYQPGRTLQHCIAKNGGGLDEHWIRGNFVRLLNGLREVHSNRLVHLDIKPANIYIGDHGEPMLIDFGAARMAFGPQPVGLPPTYTPGFASPEHHGGLGALGPWSDIYSIGACLYACLSGQPPLPAIERLREEPASIQRERWARKYSAGLLRIVDACMQVDFEQRPGSVLALQKALLGAEPAAEAASQAPQAGIAACAY